MASRLLLNLYILASVAIVVQCVGLRVPDGFEIRHIGSNLNPTAMRTAPDGRIFFCEKHGALRVIKDDVLLDEPVLTITALSTWNERGLVGVAFDPDFETNNWLYIQYVWTDGTQVRARTSRFTLDGDVALEGSETVIFESDPYPTDAGIHNGGSLVIDNNGFMFVFVGDVADRTLSPLLNTTFGKVFRINLDGTIPEDNPYYDTLEGKYRAIWARGFRNPFMTAYDSENDQTIIGDVGEGTWEELNLNQKGANYGWPAAEGFLPLDTNYTRPELAYKHNTGCAITGLTFYHDLEDAEFLFPEEYKGKLFLGDYCFGWIRYIDIYEDIAVRNLTNLNINTYAPVLVQGTAGGLSMTQGLDGGLYFSERGTSNGASSTNMGVLTGNVYKLIYTGSRAPVIYQQLEQFPPLPAEKVYTLFVGATGQAPLTYTWFQNDIAVANSTNNTLSFKLTAAMNGTSFRVEVSNANGTVTSNEVVVIVSGDSGLTASVWTSQSTYSAGDVIQFNTTIVDPTNDPTRLISWIIELSHQRHTHPFASFSNVVSGNVTIPLIGEMDPLQGYTFVVYVSNSIFSVKANQVLITPNLGKLTLETDPPGLGLLIDEVDTYPIYSMNITGVVNMERTLYAPGAQSIGNDTYLFVGWSDGDTNNEKSVPFSNSVQLLQANYCSTEDCPDLPLAPITERPLIPRPVGSPQTPTMEPTGEAPITVDTPNQVRQVVSSFSPFSESIGSTKTIISLLFCVLFM